MVNAPRPILWHQGLFLQPHHFQQLEVNFNNLLSTLFTYTKPYFWGITELEIDNNALTEGYFRIKKLNVLFQDGSLIKFPGNAKIVSRSFNDLLKKNDSQQSFQIYIGLPKWAHNSPNVKEINDKDFEFSKVRYISSKEPEEIHDIYLNDTLASVKFLNYAINIFWETELENLGDYFLIPVAEIKRDGANVILSDEFIPPMLILKGSDKLKQIIRNIKEHIISRLQILEGYKLSKDVSYSDLQGNSLKYIMALMVLNRYIPLLNHILNGENIHPWEIYGILRGFIGELSSFTDRINALGITYNGNELIPEYDHINLSECFLEISTLIEELLNSIIAGAENIIKFEKIDSEFFAKIPWEILESDYKFHIVFNSKMDKSKFIDSIKHVIKIAPKEIIPTLISRALSGIKITQKNTPPSGIPHDPNALYFELDTSDPTWLEVKKMGNICVYWDDAPDDLKIMLVVSKF